MVDVPFLMPQLRSTLTLCLLPIFLIAQETNTAPRLPLSGAILARVPADYRDEAKRLVKSTEEDQQAATKMSDENLAATVVAGLCRVPEAAGFLVQQLEQEKSARLRITLLQGLRSHWAAHPETIRLIENYASSDPDASVSVKALQLLRQLHMAEINRLLAARLTVAMKSNDASGRKQLGDEEELLYSLTNEIMLPSYMRTAPPAFSLKPADQPIRVLAFGDFGTGSMAQTNLAKSMVGFNKSHPFDFGITLGDNFYSTGMKSPADPRWQSQWEMLYGPMGIQFYATMGNHDWGSGDSPAAEILYSEKSTDWHLPAPYYTFTAGAVQFFAIDTVEVNQAELDWLDSELAKSTARWKLVYGHYHIYSATRGDNKVLIQRLLPVLKKNHVDVYLNGHDHNLQEEKSEDGVHFFVSGGGGADLYDFNPYDRTIFKEKLNGFTVIEADAGRLAIVFVGADGKEIYRRTLPETVAAHQ